LEIAQFEQIILLFSKYKFKRRFTTRILMKIEVSSIW
jgi:hypothetical protein